MESKYLINVHGYWVVAVSDLDFEDFLWYDDPTLAVGGMGQLAFKSCHPERIKITEKGVR